jgi:mannose-P-dolichol utilization defect protein 1
MLPPDWDVSGNVSRELVTLAYNANNILMLVARLPQIYKNFKDKSTGQLSLITYGVNTVGCVARIFTTMQEGGGDAMLRSYILGKWSGSGF